MRPQEPVGVLDECAIIVLKPSLVDDDVLVAVAIEVCGFQALSE